MSNNHAVESKDILILIGFMGTGKSSVGRALAKKLNYRFIDLDSEIEKNAGMKINDIFETFGEKHFREIEKKAVESLRNLNKVIVATGGGVVKDPDNFKMLKSIGTVIALDADLDTLWKRLRFSRNRPLLQVEKPREKVKELYFARKHLYLRAHFVIQTGNKSIPTVVQEIMECIQSKISNES